MLTLAKTKVNAESQNACFIRILIMKTSNNKTQEFFFNYSDLSVIYNSNVLLWSG